MQLAKMSKASPSANTMYFPPTTKIFKKKLSTGKGGKGVWHLTGPLFELTLFQAKANTEST